MSQKEQFGDAVTDAIERLAIDILAIEKVLIAKGIVEAGDVRRMAIALGAVFDQKRSELQDRRANETDSPGP